MPNRLANESSPYLRQHAGNPVDWYPWGPEALERARNEQKPILLSIGYAACHWCHVMAHESFEDAATAKLMNDLFVNIKVDREERPDLDAIYMQAVQAMTGNGGWPMTVFLTPGGEPFWGGTYFPPDERGGMPGFRGVLRAVSGAYTSRPQHVAKATTAMRDLYATAARTVTPGQLTPGTLAHAYASAALAYDERNGGFGVAPKFPPTMLLEFLLLRWVRASDDDALAMARNTFAHMSAGGIHDHVGGGFHRYATDAVWLVPHFEKMLYDNALLARFGAHLWQATHDDAVRETTEGILRWVAREMTSPEGGFYASLDADSGGHEGTFYTWTEKELDAELGAGAAAVRDWYGVTGRGNFEGRSILNASGRANGAPVPPDVAAAVPLLYAARARRVWPALDDKIIAEWNGLMLRGVATCARAFGSDEWRDLAIRNAEFLATHLVRDDAAFRIWARGAASIPGFLADYAAVALGYLDVWQLTGDRVWLDRARALGDAINARFWDESLPGFYDTSSDHELLITRPRDLYDNALPSGSSTAIELSLRLGYITGEREYTRRAGAALAQGAESMADHPNAFGHVLCAADMLVHGATAVAVVGTVAGRDALLAQAERVFLPSAIVAGSPEGANADLALFEGRDARGAEAAAYICRGPVCDAPASTPAELDARLSTVSSLRK